MNTSELLQSVQFVTDADGNKTAVQIDYAAWEDLLTLLEGIENDGESQAVDRPLRPFGLCAGEFAVPDDFDDPLPKEILKEFEGRI